ncbi:hypothetical protein ACFFJB_10410 [Camelimonas abortus]|uniref:Tetratricopeptide repeat protein n=1 Tax=Camelimonas abortus TaxID=1017184 RepID=A0ABV7LE59_9HYPH
MSALAVASSRTSPRRARAARRLARPLALACLTLGGFCEPAAAQTPPATLLRQAPASQAGAAGAGAAPDAPTVKAGQGAPDARAADAADGRVVTRQGAEPDTSALRYYVLSRQKERADAELRRLQRLYPGWTPPKEIFDAAEPAAGDEEPFWALFAADRLDELLAAIEARRKAEPGWRPSRDLAAKVARKVLRRDIEKASSEGKEKLVLAALQDSGLDVRDLELDLLWLVAAAQARSGQPEKAMETYRLIMSGDYSTQERIATIQKAMTVLPMEQVDELAAMARTVNGVSELEPIAIDLIRARISAFLKEERKTPLPAEEMQRFEEYARASEDPEQSALVAWYYYNQKDYRTAYEWFKQSMAKGGDAMVAHGLALTLVNLTMYREAEEVAYAWRNALINNMILYIDILERDLTKAIPPYIEPERLARYGQVTMELTSGEGAQALAWYAYNSCQYDVALQWFERAMAWFPKEATAYGYALALDRMKDRKTLADVINRYDGLFYKVVELVFPDGTLKPPTPCDLAERQQAEQRSRRRNRQTAETAAARPGDNAAWPVQGQIQGQIQDPRQQVLAGAGLRGSLPRVPTPDASLPAGVTLNPALQQQPQQAYPAQPKLTAKEFPISVNPANPLRFPGVGPGAVVGAPYRVPAPGYLVEPVRGPWPLVARRVPGVGPMPYERHGFSLLPGWNGVTAPTTPNYATQPAPSGTLWADQRHADQYIGGR